MKYISVIFFLLSVIFTAFHEAQAQTDGYFVGVFSNTTNTIKFTIGAYPSSISQSKKSDGTVYSAMRIVIINNEKAQPIEWNDYKIYILLKDGSLFYNFHTNLVSGEYACKYSVKPGETHVQLVCFEKTFCASEIDKVWLSFSEKQFLPLSLYKEDIKIATPAAPADSIKARATQPAKK